MVCDVDDEHTDLLIERNTAAPALGNLLPPHIGSCRTTNSGNTKKNCLYLAGAAAQQAGKRVMTTHRCCRCMQRRRLCSIPWRI